MHSTRQAYINGSLIRSSRRRVRVYYGHKKRKTQIASSRLHFSLLLSSQTSPASPFCSSPLIATGVSLLLFSSHRKTHRRRSFTARNKPNRVFSSSPLIAKTPFPPIHLHCFRPISPSDNQPANHYKPFKVLGSLPEHHPTTMAVTGGVRVLPYFECRSDPDLAGNPKPEKSGSRFFGKAKTNNSVVVPGSLRMSSLIFRFPPNFVRQLSIKARRNCSNIGVAQVVAASWSDNNNIPSALPSVDACSSTEINNDDEGIAAVVVNDDVEIVDGRCMDSVQLSGLAALKASFLRSDGSIAVHAGERLGRGIFTDGITTPVVNTTAYWFKNSDELIDFKEGRYASFEYARYGNPTTVVLEEKLSALEGAESTVIVASGMYASTIMMFALVKQGGHIVTTTDCYRKTRIFIQEYLVPNLGISVTIIDPADMNGLKSALDQNNVDLFFTESPTNPYLRCVDIDLVSKLCHSKGALVCVDGTFATPLNQKALALGADIVLHSATKYIGGHNDVLGGCLSGSKEVIAKVRKLHHVLGGTLNPNAAYLIIRGMKTLHLRVQQQNSTALRMAKVLEAHPKVTRVHYPGLPSHPEHHIAKRQMTGFGGVVSFEIDGDLDTTKKFVDALKIPYIAPSFGGCESIVDQPAIMSYWDLSQSGRAVFGIKDNLIRFSFGVEDFEDLKADILQALETI